MPLFLVERDVPGLTESDLRIAQLALTESCRLSSVRGSPVRYVRSTLVPASARCLCLFEASAVALVEQVNEAAQFPFSWIGEALELPSPAGSGGRAEH